MKYELVSTFGMYELVLTFRTTIELVLTLRITRELLHCLRISLFVWNYCFKNGISMSKMELIFE